MRLSAWSVKTLGVAMLWLALGTPAEAQRGSEGRRANYGAALLLLGVAGEVDLGAADFDRELTFGGAGRYMAPVHRFIALGGQVGLRAWEPEAWAGDRNLIVDVSFVPQVTYPASGSVELYLSLPLGLSFDILDDAGFDGAVDDAIGFNFAFMAGARFFLQRDFGLLVELGYVGHSFEHEVDAVVATADVDVDLSELGIDFGLFF